MITLEQAQKLKKGDKLVCDVFSMALKRNNVYVFNYFVDAGFISLEDISDMNFPITYFSILPKEEPIESFIESNKTSRLDMIE